MCFVSSCRNHAQHAQISLRSPPSDAALDVSHHVPLESTQRSGCTLTLRASPGQCYGKGKTKAFWQAVIQVCLGCSLVEGAKAVCVCPGKPRGSEQWMNRPGGRDQEPAAILRCLYTSVFPKSKHHAVPPVNFQPICMNVLMFCLLCWQAACFRAIPRLFPVCAQLKETLCRAAHASPPHRAARFPRAHWGGVSPALEASGSVRAGSVPHGLTHCPLQEAGLAHGGCCGGTATTPLTPEARTVPVDTQQVFESLWPLLESSLCLPTTCLVCTSQEIRTNLGDF